MSQFDPAPSVDPSCYPGRRPEHSYLLCGDHLLGLDRLDFDVELARLRAPAVRDRHPVLAYGSNACPAQLLRKFGRLGCSVVVPVTRAWLQGFAVVYSDHVSRYGAVPATLVPSDDTCTEVFVAWLDADQLVVMDRTEQVNYRRTPVDLDAHDLHVADGPVPTRLDAYVSLRGVLRLDGRVPGLAGIETTYRDGPLLTQAEVVREREVDRSRDG